ncbi:HNH endonuclease [Methylobacterium nigriterrae]|uniref:HNH endonuclease n=1 Tax=Methylobacterium nigriterrae TaxID=3127512 RepID=UPI0030137915
MTKTELARERRRQRALERLGTNDPRCACCGETHHACFEAHHIAGRRHDPVTVPLCCNCHRKVTDDQKDHPQPVPGSDPLLEAIGRFLLGLADLIRRILPKLTEFGTALIEGARSAPSC